MPSCRSCNRQDAASSEQIGAKRAAETVNERMGLAGERPESRGREWMDLNYLYHRRGESLMRAQAAGSEAARVAHRTLAALYAKRIDTVRNVLSARAAAMKGTPRGA
jgi:hypothetical protein